MAKYSISDVAAYFSISTQTLRYYDKIDLLKPSVVDEKTNYRLYSMNDMEILYLIRELKILGFSLDEIKSYCTDKSIQRLEEILRKNKRALRTQISELQVTLKHTEYYLSKVKLAKRTYQENEYEVREFPDRNAYMIDVNFEIVDLGRIAAIVSDSYLNSSAKRESLQPGHLVLVIDEEQLNAKQFKLYNSIGILLPKSTRSKGHRNIPAGLYAVAHHIGRYETIHHTYKKLHAYIEQNKYPIVGNSAEISITDNAFTENPDEYVTEIQIPVEKTS